MHVESPATTDPNLASQYSVQGREKIFGLVNFWIQLNRKTKFEVKHVGAPWVKFLCAPFSQSRSVNCDHQTAECRCIYGRHHCGGSASWLQLAQTVHELHFSLNFPGREGFQDGI